MARRNSCERRMSLFNFPHGPAKPRGRSIHRRRASAIRRRRTDVRSPLNRATAPMAVLTSMAVVRTVPPTADPCRSVATVPATGSCARRRDRAKRSARNAGPRAAHTPLVPATGFDLVGHRRCATVRTDRCRGVRSSVLRGRIRCRERFELTDQPATVRSATDDTRALRVELLATIGSVTASRTNRHAARRAERRAVRAHRARCGLVRRRTRACERRSDVTATPLTMAALIDRSSSGPIALAFARLPDSPDH